MKKSIVTEKYIIKRLGSRSRTISVEIGAPVRTHHLDFECPIRITSVTLSKVAGASSIQVLVFALNVVESTFEKFEQEGWKFYFLDGSGEVPWRIDFSGFDWKGKRLPKKRSK